MWPKGFRVFKVSPEVARAALMARDRVRAEEELPQLDLASHRVADPRGGFDLDLAQQAMGERFLDLLGALAISSAPVSARLLVMPGNDDLAPEVRSGLAEYFGISAQGEQFEHFVSQLASEFYHWAKSHREERREFGLDFDSQGRVFLECPEQRPDLEPLDQ